jgi:hypothetical protein
MPTSISGKKAASKSTGHRHVGPPTPSNIPPMAPPTPTGVPAPFVFLANVSTASGTASKLEIGGGEACTTDTKMDCDPPNNQPSQPAPIHDLATMLVGDTVTID